MTEGSRRDQRDILRIRVRVAVSGGGHSGVLGTTRDLSLGGVYVDTPNPLPVDARVPLSLLLPTGELRLAASVVRRDKGGMGLRFEDPDSEALRQIRRFVTSETAKAGARETAVRLHGEGRSTTPVTERGRIAALLRQSIEATEDLLLFPPEGHDRETGRIAALEGNTLRIRTSRPSALDVGLPLLVLYTLDFVSYSFTCEVRSARGTAVELSLPTEIVYSERRNTLRLGPEGGAEILWPLPWDPGSFRRWPVLEVGGSGLSFRADPAAFDLRPGMPLPGAILRRRGQEEPLATAQVRHITRAGLEGTTWLKVGVSLGRGQGSNFLQVAELRGRPRFAAVRRMWEWLQATLGRRRAARSMGTNESLDLPLLVHIGPTGTELAGLLNRTWAGEERRSCPLMIVVPGFAGRKETMSRMAMILLDSFRRNYADLAVLRIDTSNNLGESWKDPGFEGEGRTTLHHTTSGTVADLKACLEWAEGNPFVTPTHVVVVSVSFAAVPVRHALTQPWASKVALWVSYMGSPDVRDSVLHVTGHLDMFENATRGQRSGVVAIAGALVDVDHFYDDVSRLGVGNLEDACQEMDRLRCDVLWFMGRYDTYMDPRRVEQVMSHRPQGARRDLIVVEAGHIPRSGPVALLQFEEMARRVATVVLGREITTRTPSLAWLEEVEAREWRRARRLPRKTAAEFWREYLLSGRGPGFDVLMWAPPYEHFMEQQAALVAGEGLDVLELGAGTGNLSVLLASQPGIRLVVTDLVPDALERVRRKLDNRGLRAEVRQADADGSVHVVLRRWIRGELPSLLDLADRIPGLDREWAVRIVAGMTPDLHAALRGRDLDLDEVMDAAALAPADRSALVDLCLLLRSVRLGLPSPLALTTLRTDLLSGPAGLPFPDASFDRVALSLVLSYLEHPDDTLAECFRILRPGGELMASSLRLDADSSALFDQLDAGLRSLREDEIPAGSTREELLAASIDLRGQAGRLFRAEEERDFRFFEGGTLRAMLSRAGFVDGKVFLGFGQPPQGLIVRCRRP